MVKYTSAKEGYYFVHTEVAEIYNANRIKGSVVYPNPYRVYTSWIKRGYVEEKEKPADLAD